jgi:hypothetical protein
LDFEGRRHVRLAILVVPLALTGCGYTAHDWKGVVRADYLANYAEYSSDHGTYSSFNDCKTAMEASARSDGGVDERPLSEGFVYRKLHYLCVQDETEVDVAQSTVTLERNPEA